MSGVNLMNKNIHYCVTPLFENSSTIVTNFYCNEYDFRNSKSINKLLAKPIRDSDSSYELDKNIIDAVYCKLVGELSSYFNYIHGLDRDEYFWRKALGMGFYRFVVLVFDQFKMHKINFNESFFYQTLNVDSVDSVLDFEEFRSFMQNSDVGREALFTLFCFANKVSSINEKELKIDSLLSESSLNEKDKKSTTLSSILSRFKNISIKKIIIYLTHLRRTRVGLLGVYCSNDLYDEIRLKSLGRIKRISMSLSTPHPVRRSEALRASMREFVKIENDFDKYILLTMEKFLPKFIIENFNHTENECSRELARNNCHIVLSESWLSCSYTSYYLALLSYRGGLHLYNQHNCFMHQYLASNENIVSSMVDKFLAIGPRDPELGYIEFGSSYPFKINLSQEKSIEILYISGIAASIREDLVCHYPNGETALPYQRFKGDFFKKLPDLISSKIVYKGYPSVAAGYEKTYKDEDFIGDYIPIFSKYIDYPMSARELVAKSKLVIVDYLSTSYIETIFSNVPTVILRSEQVFRLNDSYKNFYLELENAKIMFTSIDEAVKHIEEIYKDPQTWWNSELVTKARKLFIDKNLKSNNCFLKNILNLANGTLKL